MPNQLRWTKALPAGIPVRSEAVMLRDFGNDPSRNRPWPHLQKREIWLRYSGPARQLLLSNAGCDGRIATVPDAWRSLALTSAVAAGRLKATCQRGFSGSRSLPRPTDTCMLRRPATD